ncbi:hypothetical protein Y032_0003g1279 [Ancylostoma ceylanicum]|uniref:Uncharacterized protein n=1 Tax=Ancylostoma ceylanicum TaxID=53326 RepID=A0A016VYL7_9BILA|nr:hypothetical protein Y032_0003g1279 [Ancylostoma ceylanicum]
MGSNLFDELVQENACESFKDRGPTPFSCRRYQQIIDLLATLTPIIYSGSPRSEDNPLLIGSKSPCLEQCWLPATAATSGKHVLACPIDKINGGTRLCT